MSESSASPVAKQSFLERHYHLLRRLHSLTGVVPIGVFLFPHLTTNSSIVWGEVFNAKKYADFGPGSGGVATFQHEVNFIHNLPALIFIEIFVLWLPIAYHAILGIYFAQSGKTNTDRYSYQANWRYAFQRISGYIGVLFLFMHISSLRWGWEYGGLMPTFDPDNAASSTAIHLQGGIFPYFNAIFYLVCVLALVFHFANGLLQFLDGAVFHAAVAKTDPALAIGQRLFQGGEVGFGIGHQRFSQRLLITRRPAWVGWAPDATRPPRWVASLGLYVRESPGGGGDDAADRRTVPSVDAWFCQCFSSNRSKPAAMAAARAYT